MLQEERHNIIISEINQNHKVVTQDLCQLLGVSLDTVRRDLNELDKAGKITKVHGGAVSKTFHLPYQQPKVYAKEEKKEIANKALTLIEDGMSILCGGGTTMLELARIIPKNLKGTFFTVSPLVALEVAQRSNVKVILLGGSVSCDTYICSGSSVISQLGEIKVDLCFIGFNGLSAKEGVTDDDWEVAQVKKALIKSASKIAFIGIAERLNTTLKIHVSSLHAIDYLVTELSPTDRRLVPYNKVKTL